MNNEEHITLLDRFAVGVLSALSALLTLGVLALILIYIMHGDYILITLKVCSGVVLFFFVLGFATLDNYFISILAPIWKFIGNLFRWF